MDMNTTNIFVELVVVGFHTLIWIGLFALAFLGFEHLDLEKLFTINLALPILALTYIFGILIDRASDLLLDEQDNHLRSQYDFSGLPSFLEMRFYILSKSSDVYEQLEYARSRLRIARASIFNFALTTVAAVLLVWFQFGKALGDYRLIACIITVVVGVALTWVSYQAWEALSKTYTVNTMRAFKVLRDEIEKDRAAKTKAA
jgi:hypothetical protein